MVSSEFEPNNRTLNNNEENDAACTPIAFLSKFSNFPDVEKLGSYSIAILFQAVAIPFNPRIALANLFLLDVSFPCFSDSSSIKLPVPKSRSPP